MSTYVYLACLDHDPALIAHDESEQHLGDELLTKIRRWVDDRSWLIGMLYSDEVELTDYYARNSARFLADHPACRIAARTEYGDWLDLGQGVPTTQPGGTTS